MDILNIIIRKENMEMINVKYLTIFVLIYFIYICFKSITKSSFIDKNKGIAYFLITLDNYYIKNKKFTIFMLIFYLVLTCLIFIIMRIQLLGTSININFTLISTKSILDIIIIILIIKYYLKTLDIIFHHYVIQMHLYLYQYSYYIHFCDVLINDQGITSNIMYKISSFFSKITLVKSEILLSYKKDMILNKTTSNKIYYRNILFLNKFLCQSIYMKKLLYVIKNIFFFLYRYSSDFLYYITHTFVIIIALYDLTNGSLHYIYYALLIYLITSFIKKFRRFFYVKDCLYDNMLSNYFYKDAKIYKKMNEKIKNLTIENIKCMQNEELKKITYHYQDISEYIINNFQVYYITNKTRANNEIILKNNEKRKQILFLYIIIIIYLINNNEKYIINVNNYININLYGIIFIILILLLLLNRKILYKLENMEENLEWIENKIYKTLFLIISISFIIIICYIILKNNYVIFPNETIINFHYIQVFVEMTYKTKLEYLQKYFNTVYSSVENIRLESILPNITENMTLNEMKIYVDNYMKNFKTKNDKDFLSIFQKIKQFFLK